MATIPGVECELAGLPRAGPARSRTHRLRRPVLRLQSPARGAADSRAARLPRRVSTTERTSPAWPSSTLAATPCARFHTTASLSPLAVTAAPPPAASAASATQPPWPACGARAGPEPGRPSPSSACRSQDHHAGRQHVRLPTYPNRHLQQSHCASREGAPLLPPPREHGCHHTATRGGRRPPGRTRTRTCRQRPAGQSQTRAVKSSATVTAMGADGATRTPFRRPVCPASTCTHWPVARSQTLRGGVNT